MRQQIRDAEYGVPLRFADADGQHRAIDAHHHAVQRQRKRDPLVFLDAAVVLGVQVSQAVLLVEGVLLQVDAGRVDVRPEDLHALPEWALSHHEQHDGLVHPAAIHPTSGRKLAPFGDGGFKVGVPGGLCQLHSPADALPFGLALVNKRAVLCCERMNRIQRGPLVLIPGR